MREYGNWKKRFENQITTIQVLNLKHKEPVKEVLKSFQHTSLLITVFISWCEHVAWGIVGLICAIVALNATAPTGDRRGRGAAVTGLCLNIGWIVTFALVAAGGGAFNGG